MQKDEVLLFTQFDSDPDARARFCFHTAFDDPTVDPRLPQRQSVEPSPATHAILKLLRREGVSHTLVTIQLVKAIYSKKHLFQTLFGLQAVSKTRFPAFILNGSRG